MVNRETLLKLAKVLDDNHIIWGVGGSYLLQLHGLYSNPDDLDIWTQPEDIPKIKEIFSDFEQIDSEIQLPPEYHFKMLYYDTEVDFVSCFITIPNKDRFEYYISPNNIQMVELDDGFQIPCTFLEDWYIVYKLLKREKKAQIIEKVFTKKEKDFSSEIIESSLGDKRNHMQQRVRKDAHKLIINSLQMSIFDKKYGLGEEHEASRTSTTKTDINK